MGQPEHEIAQALHRTRRRWLLSAMINAGGRWAVLPATMVALAGMVFVLVWQVSWLGLAVLVLLGLAGVVLALALTLRAYARPGVAGSPDYALLLDRSLALGDALPAYLESTGKFRAALARRIADGLDSRKEKAAAPQRHFGPLAIALILSLLPLALSQMDRPPASPERVSGVEGQDAADNEAPAGGNPAAGMNAQDSGEEAGEEEGKDSSGGKEEEVPGQPQGSKAEEGAGEAPHDRQPTPSPESPQPDSGGAGDEKGVPETPEPPKDPDIKNDFEKVRPEATQGDTAKVDRSRWIYNPDAKTLDESTPAVPDPKGGNERAVDRNKVTSRERKLLNELYRKLFE